MSLHVNGSIALVTGANRGIGRSIVQSLLHHGAAKVYATARLPETLRPLVQAHGQRVVPIPLDLDKPETITAAARAARDVNIVINNAGILKAVSPLAPDAIPSFQQELQTNVFGLLWMAQAFAPVLKANGGGVFVQLNSVASLKNFADFATYCASKAAAYSLTQALRDTLAQQNTSVISVHPGPIKTDMAVAAGLDDMADPPEVVSEAVVAAIEAGDFHVFPDSMAKQIGAAYASFAENIIEANLSEA